MPTVATSNRALRDRVEDRGVPGGDEWWEEPGSFPHLPRLASGEHLDAEADAEAVIEAGADSHPGHDEGVDLVAALDVHVLVAGFAERALGRADAEHLELDAVAVGDLTDALGDVDPALSESSSGRRKMTVLAM